MQTVFSRWPAILLFAAGWAVTVYNKGVLAGLYAMGLALLTALLYRLIRSHNLPRKALAYLVFFATPLLTITGQIGVLTGFDSTQKSLPWMGISYISAALAVHILQGRVTTQNLILSIMQPVRWNSGPNALPHDQPFRRAAFFSLKRLWSYVSWVTLGAFFYGVLGNSLSQLMILKESMNALDVLVFAAIFQIYMYFNFCGISFIAYGILSVFGVRTSVNFNTPFAGQNLIGYWQRWHLSLSAILKDLYFKPVKPMLGLFAATMMVFMFSAFWHGITNNFLMWGALHGVGWYVTYLLHKTGKIGQVVNWVLFPFVVVLGQLMFSEIDPHVLWDKIVNVVRWDVSIDSLWLNLELDGETRWFLGLSCLWIAFEVLVKRWSHRYWLMRCCRRQISVGIWRREMAAQIGVEALPDIAA